VHGAFATPVITRNIFQRDHASARFINYACGSRKNPERFYSDR
jgi:hypothetical protein